MLKKYKDDQEFYNLVGIKPQTFYKMLEILKIAESKQKYYGGRKNKIVIEERLLMTLEYWKDYSSYRVIAKRYNISHTSCIRNIFWIENILIKSGIFNRTSPRMYLWRKQWNWMSSTIYFKQKKIVWNI
ncbi:transposase family protein [Spiroplasma endosymbiont of Zeiraphera isertana]|uniref:helix-turn-helix domain-containing protein n=1 Tax=Spiroplasma endosymbiont of Zeiraphera isertana TaxID=3066313 RepID=UPI00313D29ED